MAENNSVLVMGVLLILSLCGGIGGAYYAYNKGYTVSEETHLKKLEESKKAIAEKDEEIAKLKKSAVTSKSPDKKSEERPPVKVSSLTVADIGTPGLDVLNQTSQNMVLEILNTIGGPCEPCYLEGLSIAACMKAKPVCKNLPKLASRAVRMAKENKSKEDIEKALTYKEGWVPIDLSGSFIKGPENAPVTIVEYSEFQCPFCSRAQSVVAQIFEKYGDNVRLIFKHYPLSRHTLAKPAAKAAIAAGRQGQFYPYKLLLFEHQKELRNEGIFEELAKELNLDLAKFNADLADEKIEEQIMKDAKQGQRLGVRGTPTFFVNGYLMRGAKPLEAYVEVIDRELADLGLL